MRHKLALLAVSLTFTFLAGASPAGAWGKFGHLTVCELAYRNFTPATQAAVRELLATDQGGIKVKGRGRLPDRWYTSFNVGCLEEDEMPRRHREDHFINVARSVTVIEDDSCPDAGECILAGIARDLAILGDTSRPREERVFALMALGHWVGDIHQPLHISFADDRGGNGVQAKLQGRCGTSAGKPDNLHAVWDNCHLEAGLFERVRQRRDFPRSWSRNTITYRAVDTLHANTDLRTEQAIIAQEEPRAWAQESYAVMLDPGVLYCVRSAEGCSYSDSQPELTRSAPQRLQPIKQEYLRLYAPVAHDRIRSAGYRLAHLINSALDPAYSGPSRDRSQPE